MSAPPQQAAAHPDGCAARLATRHTEEGRGKRPRAVHAVAIGFQGCAVGHCAGRRGSSGGLAAGSSGSSTKQRPLGEAALPLRPSPAASATGQPALAVGASAQETGVVLGPQMTETSRACGHLERLDIQAAAVGQAGRAGQGGVVQALAALAPLPAGSMQAACSPPPLPSPL